jgi:RNA polymerase sigma-70 factor (ECF subfamily)
LTPGNHFDFNRILVTKHQIILSKRTEDIKIIKQALQGSQLAYQQLYQMYKHPLFMVCLRYAKDKSIAQDYLQEAFINIFKNLNQFVESKGAFEAWAKRVTINICLMDLRKQSLYAVGIDGAENIESKTVDVLSDLSLKEMLEMIQRLPQGYKTVFNMYAIDGFSHKEIAEELSISINTSKSQLRKARVLLQKKILANQQLYHQVHG